MKLLHQRHDLSLVTFEHLIDLKCPQLILSESLPHVLYFFEIGNNILSNEHFNGV